MSYPPQAPLPNPVFNQQFKSIISSPPKGGKSYFQCLDQKHWALTYDDGPTEYTPLLLDQLAVKGVKATFFVIGSKVANYPQHLKRILDEGHEIGIHTWSHPYLNKVNSEGIVSEVLYTYKIIKEITGLAVRIVRCPYGDGANKNEQGSRVLNIINGLGFDVVQWNYDTKDWEDKGATTVSKFQSWIRSNVPAPITLEHELSKSMVEAGKYALDAIPAAGYKIVKISECLGIKSTGDILSNLNVTVTSTTSSINSQPTSVPASQLSGSKSSSVVGIAMLLILLLLI